MREDVHADGLVTWSFDLAERAGVVAAVTTRVGGASTGAYAGCNLGGQVGDDPAAVAANRAAVARALGVDDLTIPDQQHGRRVAVVAAGVGPDDDLVATDALVTLEPGRAVAVLAADCAPVVLVDPVARAVAVAHSGRKGTVLDVLGATVATLVDVAGSRPADLLVGVGPCIGASAYEIDGEALAEVEAAFGGAFLTPSRPGRAYFDLQAAVVHRLVEAGVPAGSVELAGATTDTRQDRFFSDRAARPCGRFGVVAALR